MLILHSPDEAAQWLHAQVHGTLRSDSRQLRPGDGFIAWPGHATDARRFVPAALAAGAAACLIELEGAAAFGLPDDARVAALAGLKAATGEVAAIFHGRPGAELAMLAVTGTNGKSSTAWWTAQALTALGRRCGVVGTLGIGEPPPAGPAQGTPVQSAAHGSVQATGLTTPDPVTLQAALRDMVDSGFVACAIEASSIGIAEQRMAGLPVRVAQFTNLTPDHLDYHADMAAYWACKRALFDTPGLRAAVVNIDDPHGLALATELAERALDLWTVSTTGPARLRAQHLRYEAGGLSFEVLEDGVSRTLRSALVGDYNASNLLVVLAGLRALGVDADAAVQVAHQLSPVPGRMQTVRVAGAGPAQAQPTLVVDYAHTPDALEKALAALRPMAAERGGQLWCVFGCGGNRDASKRGTMGAIAQRLADRVLVTSDNPRHEAPGAILAQIAAGMLASPEPLLLLQDRRLAIEYAVLHARAADVVLIAGKGHETTQEIAGVKLPFSDVTEAERVLALHAQGVLMTLGEAARLLPGARLVGDALTPFKRVHSDSRSLRAGDLFVALRGEHFDGHDFLPQLRLHGAEAGLAGAASAAGAAAALAERGLFEAGLPGLLVDDSLAALQQLATAWRAAWSIPVIAVAGSNGKTTVTQMLAAILRAWLGEAALATAGNLNNHIGLPLSVLRLHSGHRAAVFELGMNHPGEMAVLARITQATVAVVNNAQREHQEFMASVAAVAHENGAAISALGADGVAVFPADDEQAPVWRALAGQRRCVTFALDGPADVTGQAQWTSASGKSGAAHAPRWLINLRTPLGTARAELHLAGRHNLHNALAACASAVAAGVPLAAIVSGLGAFQPVAGRSQLGLWQRCGRAVALVDDSYNANPDSVRAAISLLAGMPGPHWLVLGDMGEVGDQGPAFHAEVGAFAAEQGVDTLWTVGAQSNRASSAFKLLSAASMPDAGVTKAPIAAAANVRHFDSVEALIQALPDAPPCASALVKGSRFMRMERVVAALRSSACGVPHAA